MPVDLNQWRAAIGSFQPTSGAKEIVHCQLQPFSTLFTILKLYLFCCIFITISIPIIPIIFIVQTTAIFSFYRSTCFLRLFAQLYSYVKTICALIELLKRMKSVPSLGLCCGCIRRRVDLACSTDSPSRT